MNQGFHISPNQMVRWTQSPCLRQTFKLESLDRVFLLQISKSAPVESFLSKNGLSIFWGQTLNQGKIDVNGFESTVTKWLLSQQVSATILFALLTFIIGLLPKKIPLQPKSHHFSSSGGKTNEIELITHLICCF